MYSKAGGPSDRAAVDPRAVDLAADRRALEQGLRAALEAAAGSSSSVSVVSVGLEGAVEAGDARRALECLVRALEHGVGEHGSYHRTGPRQFLVLLPGHSHSSARSAMEWIATGVPFPVTFGIAEYPEDGLTGPTLIEVAEVTRGLMPRGRPPFAGSGGTAPP